MTPKRYRRCILATCCVPWTEDWQFAEDIFRRQISGLVTAGIRDLYIFGTAGEGYAVTDTQFDQITRVFLDETSRHADVRAMVGLISLSLPTVIERIERAADMGARWFQISLPSWGALNDAEMATFFRETCGPFPGLEFLHYNLPRTHRIVTPAEYATLAAQYPNLVATKNSTTDLERIKGLQTKAAMLQHFITERGFADAAMLGECGLLISIASTNFQLGQRYFTAGRQRDHATLEELRAGFIALSEGMRAIVGQQAHMDGAYDKLYCRLHDPEFPLRLLPPYAAVSEGVFAEFAEMVRERV